MLQFILILITCILTSALFFSPLVITESFGHRDGCHRWHSCPSDDGSYVCGDLGYDDECGGSEEEEEEEEDKDSRSSLNDDEDNNNRNNDDDEENNDNNSNSDDNRNENNDAATETSMTNRNSISSDLCSGNANCFTGTITDVIDGDTVDIDEEIRLRLSLVNTPERDEQGYGKAKEFVENVCGVGTKVLVDEDDGQKGGSYGRMIGLIYCGDERLLLNQMIVENGYADILESYCERSEFSELNWAQNHGCD